MTGETYFLWKMRLPCRKEYFPGFQHDFSALGVELSNLHLTGATRADDLSSDLTDIIRGDGSDAVGRLVGPIARYSTRSNGREK